MGFPNRSSVTYSLTGGEAPGGCYGRGRCNVEVWFAKLCVPVDACNSGDLIMATADAIRYDLSESMFPFIYGLQILPAGGGGPEDSYAVDFNGNLTGFRSDKNW